MHSSRSFAWSVASVLAALWGALLLGGCQPLAEHARTAYDTAGLTLDRTDWDTLRAQPRFVRRTSLDGAQPVQPETTFVHVFSADYDTLYAGPATANIALPDRQLASREPLLVEACGAFPETPGQRGRRAPPKSTSSHAARALCEQATVSASPKRVRATKSRITFPEGPDFRRGRYDVRLVVERRAFRDTTWERVEAAGLPSGSLLARVQGAGGQGTVRVPMDAGGQGDFDLARHAGYDDFQYHLRSSMKPVDNRQSKGEAPPEAVVAFEVQASLNGAAPQPVSHARKEVRRLTPAERARRVQLLARSAAKEIVRRLHEGRDEDEGRRAKPRATVVNWRLDRLEGRYEIDLRIRWGAGDFFGRAGRYTLEGALTVETSSRQARFTGERGNNRAVRRWRRTVDGDELSLGRLEEPTEDGSLQVEKERLRDLADRRSSRGRQSHRREREAPH